jgi:hypothetical protein
MKDIYGVLDYNGKEYKIAFNFNVMQEIQEEYGTISAWSELTDGDEPNAKAVIFGIRAMLNEGIEITNEETGSNDPPLSLKQVGRIISEVGFGRVAKAMNETIIGSVQGPEKNG